MCSEVARLKECLRLEAEAAFQGLYGYAEVAKHEIIHQKLERVGEVFEQLKEQIGEEEAALFMLDTMEKA
jgi:hypothetical protein